VNFGAFLNRHGKKRYAVLARLLPYGCLDVIVPFKELQQA
jgi:hypothetical protein